MQISFDEVLAELVKIKVNEKFTSIKYSLRAIYGNIRFIMAEYRSHNSLYGNIVFKVQNTLT